MGSEFRVQKKSRHPRDCQLSHLLPHLLLLLLLLVQVAAKPLPSQMGKHVFVTVGTTKFDPMVEAIDRPAVLSSLFSNGFSSLTAQIGHGHHVPSFPVDPVCSHDRVCGYL